MYALGSRRPEHRQVLVTGGVTSVTPGSSRGGGDLKRSHQSCSTRSGATPIDPLHREPRFQAIERALKFPD